MSDIIWEKIPVWTIPMEVIEYERKIAALKAELEEAKKELLRRLDRLEESEKQVENLKCCANCSYFDNLNLCIKTHMFTVGRICCEAGWKHDSLTAEERMAK